MVDKLTPDQIDQCRRLFDIFDINKDRSISAKEVGKVMRSLNLNPSNAEVDAMIRRADSRGTGRIEFNEFLHMYAEKIREPITREDVIRYFQMFDRNGDGRIDPKEFKQVMTTMGEPLTNDEIDFIISEADKDLNGYIDYKEFSEMLLEKII
ncbi:unnamed protein product [Blepharisma stoltei]|uniref:Calmodulin n=1 Tax=Blepharisma stoltei TaxID=1481888 RepID=A0AAU9JUN3_9CILI|nr:unnamed protein product [Blepharisma stoltei]